MNQTENKIDSVRPITTPEPWRVAQTAGGGFRIIDQLDRMVALFVVHENHDTRGGSPYRVDVANANANLMSAAPELLDAVRNLLPWAKAYIETQRTALHGSAEFKRIEWANEAIAKAEGRA